MTDLRPPRTIRPPAGATRRARDTRPPAALLVLPATVIAAQVAYPLASGAARDTLTVAVVLLLAATCAVHAALTRGVRFAATMVVVTAGAGLAAEVVGVHTGWPFGSYVYTGALGPRLAGVPLLVALAWTMLAWPAAIAARYLARSFAARVAVGTWATAACDLFLDPQQVHAGYWRWAPGGPHLPGVPAVPLSNLAGWLLVSLVISLALQRLVTSTRPADGVMAGLYLWLFAGWTVALAVFLGLPAAAGWGALGMGTVALPLAYRLVRR